MSNTDCKRYHMRRYHHGRYQGTVRVEALDIRSAFERARQARPEYANATLVVCRIDHEWEVA